MPRWPARQSGLRTREAVGIAQVDAVGAAPAAAPACGRRPRRSAAAARPCCSRPSSSTSPSSSFSCQARRADSTHLHGPLAQRRQQLRGTPRSAAPPRPRVPSGPTNTGRRVVGRRLEHLAVGVHQRACRASARAPRAPRARPRAGRASAGAAFAWRTQGSFSNAARAASRSSVKKLPLQLARARSPAPGRAWCARRWPRHLDLAQREDRQTHDDHQQRHTAGSSAGQPRTARWRCAFSRRWLSHMGQLQDAHAPVPRMRCPPPCAAIGTRLWPVMPGEVFISSSDTRAVGAPDQVGPAPAAAAERLRPSA